MWTKFVCRKAALIISRSSLFESRITHSAQAPRRYIPQENDPDFKRYINVETENGELKMIDLREGGTVTPRVGVSDVEYDLYTRSNQDSPFTITNNDINSLSSSNFDPKKVSIFVSHGWNNNRGSSVNTLIKEAIFGNYDINLFIVDWSGPANEFYLTAKSSVVPVGEIIGQFINSIQDTYGLDGSSFVLIGHSLGAHVAGSAGATVTKKVANIIGLDPAGPLFTLDHPEERLDVSDAQFVEVVHTDGNLLGFASSIGDVDYFPNGGMSQPGCGIDLAGTCAHGKAYRYMAEALTRGPVFKAHLCSDWTQFQAGSCNNNQLGVMGEVQITTTTLGDYFLETNADEPFGQS
ncbi:pancreatic triacylglycerol lipase-like isoform X2 [Zophobas morio]|uniref:pancreatic triacylglycerol lipase-like isoform X2 n=1 Tax=Zophobas morio TaxID=2755281 RepID=UPI0030828720